MSKLIERRNVQAIGYGIITLILAATGYFSDKILLELLTKNKEMYKHEHHIYQSIYRASGNKPKTLDLTKANYGPYVTEGSLTTEAELNLAHHDNYNDFKKK